MYLYTKLGVDKFLLLYYNVFTSSDYYTLGGLNMKRTKPYFPNFEGEVVRRNVSKKVIATTLGITERTLRNKLSGKSPLTWPEADRIQKKFFPDKEKDYLFSRTA